MVAALVVGLPTVLSDRLPSPVASHWGPSGEPDDSLPLGGVVAIALGPVQNQPTPSTARLGSRPFSG